MNLFVRSVPLVICIAAFTVFSGTTMAAPAAGVLPVGSNASVAGGTLTVQANPGYDNQITVQPGTVPLDVGGSSLHTYSVSDGQLIQAGPGCIQSGPIAVICPDEGSNPITGIEVIAGDGTDSLQIQDQDPTGAFVGSIPWAKALGGGGDDRIVNFNEIYGDDVAADNGNDYLVLDPAPPNWGGSGYGGYISAGTGDDYLRGNDGNDTLIDHGGTDTIEAGAGDDFVDTDRGGEPGPDSISLGSGNDVADASAGNDSISLGAGDDTVHGFDGADTITSSGGSSSDVDIVYGGPGSDRLVGGVGRDELRGGSQNDTIIDTAPDRPDLLFGESGADYIDSRSSLVYLGDTVDCGTEIDVLDRDSKDAFSNCETVNTF